MFAYMCINVCMYVHIYIYMFTLALTYGFAIIFTIALFNIDLSKAQRTLTRPLLDVSSYLVIYQKQYVCICYKQMFIACSICAERC